VTGLAGGVRAWPFITPARQIDILVLNASIELPGDFRAGAPPIASRTGGCECHPIVVATCRQQSRPRNSRTPTPGLTALIRAVGGLPEAVKTALDPPAEVAAAAD
jgi:hypothetical protein